MDITGISLKLLRRGIQVTVYTAGGDHVFRFTRSQARTLQRALFLQVGIDPRYTGRDTLPEYLEKRKGEEE